MQLRSRMKWFVALAVLGYTASPAGAQTAPNGAGSGSASPQTGAGGQVGFQGRVSLTPEQQAAVTHVDGPLLIKEALRSAQAEHPLVPDVGVYVQALVAVEPEADETLWRDFVPGQRQGHVEGPAL